MKLLIIEDDEVLRGVVEARLTTAGHTVVTAPDGQAGLRMAYQHRPDLIVLDVMMPGMDGWETCQRLREMSDVAILMVTARGGESEVVIAVHNHGPAIAPEHQARLFERFYRVDRSDSRRVYGFGLGLYIARKLVEGMGGRIWVDSEPANGTRFAFTAPLVKEDYLETADH